MHAANTGVGCLDIGFTSESKPCLSFHPCRPIERSSRAHGGERELEGAKARTGNLARPRLVCPSSKRHFPLSNVRTASPVLGLLCVPTRWKCSSSRLNGGSSMFCEHGSLSQNVDISTTAEYEIKTENGLRRADFEKAIKGLGFTSECSFTAKTRWCACSIGSQPRRVLRRIAAGSGTAEPTG